MRLNRFAAIVLHDVSGWDSPWPSTFPVALAIENPEAREYIFEKRHILRHYQHA